MRKLFSILLLVVLILPVANLKADELVFSTFSNGEPNLSIKRKILTKAYKKMGITFKVEQYPALRAVLLSNSGMVDGEMFRITGIELKYPNLRKIPIPVSSSEYVVFTKQKKLELLDGKA